MMGNCLRKTKRLFQNTSQACLLRALITVLVEKAVSSKVDGWFFLLAEVAKVAEVASSHQTH